MKGVNEMEDELIIELYWQRNESAINHTNKKYGNYCHKIAFNILSDHADCEECLNDAYLKVWNSIPVDKPRIFSAYLGKITRNLAINMYNYSHAKKRGGGEIELIFEELEDCLPSPQNDEGEEKSLQITQIINAFLYSLSEENRNIFVRRYWYGDSIKEIAKYFHYNQSKIKSMLFRNRKLLKIELTREGIFHERETII